MKVVFNYLVQETIKRSKESIELSDCIAREFGFKFAVQRSAVESVDLKNIAEALPKFLNTFFSLQNFQIEHIDHYLLKTSYMNVKFRDINVSPSYANEFASFLTQMVEGYFLGLQYPIKCHTQVKDGLIRFVIQQSI